MRAKTEEYSCKRRIVSEEGQYGQLETGKD
jgi:hypothetical protein